MAVCEAEGGIFFIGFTEEMDKEMWSVVHHGLYIYCPVGKASKVQTEHTPKTLKARGHFEVEQ